MSWSVSFIGKPANVAKALYDQSEKMDGQSKIEYDSALPHMVALVNETFGNEYLIKINANGHGYAVGDEQKDRQLAISIELLYSNLVV